VARALVNGNNGGGQPTLAQPDDLDRHIIDRRLRLTCIPVTHVEYNFDGRDFDFTTVGASGSERFWAESFPARWTRVGRFFRAVMSDLNGERGNGDTRRSLPGGRTPSLDEFRERRIRILPDDTGATGETSNTSDAHATSDQPAKLDN
jgi:hypothetical protein